MISHHDAPIKYPTHHEEQHYPQHHGSIHHGPSHHQPGVQHVPVSPSHGYGYGHQVDQQVNPGYGYKKAGY